MRIFLRPPHSILARAAALMLGFVILRCDSSWAQTQPEQFWLAGRYDSNRIIVYFDAVKLNQSLPSSAEKISCPIAIDLFCPVKLPAEYITQFQKGPNAEHFGLGDKYDLIVDGSPVSVTLTTLVGYESDEGVGNDSFIGALATLEEDKRDWLYFTKDYLVVCHHRDDKQRTIHKAYAQILDAPVPFDIQSKIVGLLTDRMKTLVPNVSRHEAENVSPVFAVQQFRLADGSLRYYARAGWESSEGKRQKLIFGLGAWIAPRPTLHVLAFDSASGFEYLPDLLNVIDLGSNKTGIIVSIQGDDSRSISLSEYRDSANLSDMLVLQSLGVGE